MRAMRAHRGIRRLLLAAVLAGAAGACEYPFGYWDDEAGELERSRDRWRRQGLDDYRYEFELHCFCAGELYRPATVWVRNGAVYDAVYADTGEPVPASYLRYYRTIDGLFEVIGDAINRRADDLEVEYDARYGYPRFADIDYERGAVDDEIRFVVRRLRF